MAEWTSPHRSAGGTTATPPERFNARGFAVSINPRPLASGRVVYDVRLRTPGGRPYKKTFRTKREAELFGAKERTDRYRGAWVDPNAGRFPFEDYANRWLVERPGLRPRTRELYEGLLRLHILPVLGTTNLSALTPAVIRTWYADLDRAKYPGASTTAKAYRLLRTILNTAIEDGLIARNPCVITGAGTEHSPERPVASIPQVYALADSVPDRYRAMVLLACFAGLRLGELLGLSRRDIDLEHRTVSVTRQMSQLKDGTLFLGPPKSEAGDRLVAIPDVLTTGLTKHLTNHVGPDCDALVFTGDKGGSLRRAVWQSIWNDARRSVGLPDFHFHDLRHTGNTLVAATGASTKELMVRMGHASARAALRYQHATRDRDAAIADALGSLIDRAMSNRLDR